MALSTASYISGSEFVAWLLEIGEISKTEEGVNLGTKKNRLRMSLRSRFVKRKEAPLDPAVSAVQKRTSDVVC